MATPLGSAPLDGDRNRAFELLTVSWLFFSISTVLVIGRMYSRVVVKRNVWWDDWIICVTLAFVLAFTTMFTVYAGNGGSRHTYYLTPEQQLSAIKYNWIANVLIVIPLCTGKVSVALLIQRLLPPNSGKQKWFLWFISGSLSLVIIFVVIVILCQCRPIESLWNPTITDAKCWDAEVVGNWNLFAGSYYAFMDFVLALFPTLIIRKLQMPIRKRIALCCLLGLGVFAGVCAIVKSTYLPALKAADFTWDTTTFLIWNSLETNVIIIAACIPTLNSLVPKAKEFLQSYLSRTKFSSTGYISKNSGVSASTKPAYIRQSNERDQCSIEMPTMDDHGNVGGDGIRVDHDAWTPLPDHAKVTHVSVEPSKGGYTQGYM